MARWLGHEAGLLEPAPELLVAKAEPAMTTGLAQPLEAMRRQVHHDQPTAGGKHAGSLGQGGGRVVGEVEDLMQRDRAERAVGHRQLVHVAVANLTIACLALVEVGARDRQHVVTEVDPEAEAYLAGQYLQDPAGPGADVEQAGDALGGEQLAQGALHHRWRRRRARPRCPRRQPARRRSAALVATPLAHGLEPALVEAHRGIVARKQTAERAGEARAVAGLGAAVEHPRTLAKAVEQASLGQDLEVAGDARLALADDLHQLAHGPLALRADRQETQARGIRRGANPVQEGVERGRCLYHRSRRSMSTRGYLDIFIFACQVAAAGSLVRASRTI